MEHPESVTATLTVDEPPDGTKLIYDRGGSWVVLVRDDTSADREGHPDERWYEGLGFEARTFDDWLLPTDDVYALGDQMTVFR